jgi:magnesium transporter
VSTAFAAERVTLATYFLNIKPMIKIYFRTIKDAVLQEVEKPRSGGVWVRVNNPDEAEIQTLCQQFHLDEQMVRDALDPNEVPRIETEDGVTYVFTRVPQQRGEEIVTLPILIALGETFVLTVTQQKMQVLESFLNNAVEFSTTQKVRFFLQIFFAINLAYNRYLTTISRKVRALSADLEREIENRNIVQFVHFERVLNDFVAALQPTGLLLRRLLTKTGTRLRLYEKDEDLVEDVIVENTQLEEMARATLKNIVNIRTAYETILTNNLNRTIKMLTALTIILTIPTVISSFFGMNVTVPLRDVPHAFTMLFGGTLVIVVLALWVFHWRKWL